MTNFKKPKMIKINASQADNFLKPIMQFIPKGEFMMGEGDSKKEVEIKEDFEISKYQVTFDEYDLYCEEMKKEKPNDNKWGRGRRPVINVSWHDATAYCEWLSQKTEQSYRLPTEEEWEYACRAETDTKWSFGDDEKELDKYAWYDKNSDGKTHLVGEKKSNKWNLYDMHGNVWEWCEDWYDKDKDRKVLRGGSWYNIGFSTRSSYRSGSDPSDSNIDVGFRLLRTLP